MVKPEAEPVTDPALEVVREVAALVVSAGWWEEEEVVPPRPSDNQEEYFSVWSTMKVK